MIARRGVISCFLAGHLLALTVAAIPSPADLRQSSGEREQGATSAPPAVDDVLSVRVRPLLDAGAAVMASAAAVAWQATNVMRPLANQYTGALGLVQNWKMFANPGRGAEYLRIRYYSARQNSRDDEPVTVTTELVFPMSRAEQSHAVAAFWQGHRDKAISNAFGAYFHARLSRMDAGLPAPVNHEIDGALTRNLIPVVRYFASRYTRAHAGDGVRLIRTEAWYGLAPSRPRGDVAISPASREAALARYDAGPVVQSVEHSHFSLLDTLDHEADIVWMLIYADEPRSPRR